MININRLIINVELQLNTIVNNISNIEKDIRDLLIKSGSAGVLGSRRK
jgi:hypothetical protein